MLKFFCIKLTYFISLDHFEDKLNEDDNAEGCGTKQIDTINV